MENRAVTAADLGFDPRDLEALVTYEMPFGRFAGTPLIDLPEEYLMWFEREQFPAGRLGHLMRLCLGIKRYGAEQVIKELRGQISRDQIRRGDHGSGERRT